VAGDQRRPRRPRRRVAEHALQMDDEQEGGAAQGRSRPRSVTALAPENCLEPEELQRQHRPRAARPSNPEERRRDRLLPALPAGRLRLGPCAGASMSRVDASRRAPSVGLLAAPATVDAGWPGKSRDSGTHRRGRPGPAAAASGRLRKKTTRQDQTSMKPAAQQRPPARLVTPERPAHAPISPGIAPPRRRLARTTAPGSRAPAAPQPAPCKARAAESAAATEGRKATGDRSDGEPGEGRPRTSSVAPRAPSPQARPPRSRQRGERQQVAVDGPLAGRPCPACNSRPSTGSATFDDGRVEERHARAEGPWRAGCPGPRHGAQARRSQPQTPRGDGRPRPRGARTSTCAREREQRGGDGPLQDESQVGEADAGEDGFGRIRRRRSAAARAFRRAPRRFTAAVWIPGGGDVRRGDGAAR